MVTFKSTNKFYRRHGRDKHLMSVGEIGDAFVLSAQRIDKERGVIEAWQRSRANASSTWPTLFVGTLPLQYYPRLIEPSERWVHELLAHPPSPPGPPNTVWEGIPELDDTTEDEEIIPDLDGLLRRRKNAEHLSSFHLGRNALLTLKSTHILNSAYDNEIDPRLLISTTVHFLRVSASLAEKLGFEGEMVTCLTLEDLMKREHIRMRPSVPRNETQWQRTRQQAQPCPFSRLTPEPVLWSTSDRPDRTAKRLLDMVYNAFHFGGTPLFSDSHFDRDATAPSA